MKGIFMTVKVVTEVMKDQVGKHLSAILFPLLLILFNDADKLTFHMDGKRLMSFEFYQCELGGRVG